MTTRIRPATNTSQDDFVWVLLNLQEDTKGFTRLAAMLRSVAGINLILSDKNLALMAGRLISVLRKRGLFSYDEYIQLLAVGGPELRTEFLTRMTTNTTEFFREETHFNYLKNLIPEIAARPDHKKHGMKELRIWCAVCSTGQEAYSLAMTISELIPKHEKWNVKLLASDIDPVVLETAMAGVYTQDDLKNLSSYLKNKYFTAMAQDGAKVFRVTPALRKMIQFASFNLIQDKYPFQHKFDVIFVRNVFIYFERETTKRVIERMVHGLNPEGYLFLGHTESGMVKNDLLKTISHAVYQKVPVKK